MKKNQDNIFNNLSDKISNNFNKLSTGQKVGLGIGALGLGALGLHDHLDSSASLTGDVGDTNSDNSGANSDNSNSNSNSNSGGSDNLDQKIQKVEKTYSKSPFTSWISEHPSYAKNYTGEYTSDLHKDLPWKMDRYADLDSIKTSYNDNPAIQNIIKTHGTDFENYTIKEAQAKAFDNYMNTIANVNSDEYKAYRIFLDNLGFSSYEDYVKSLDNHDPYFKALRRSNYLAVQDWEQLLKDKK